MQHSIPAVIPGPQNPSNQPESTPADSDSQPSGYHDQRGSGASALPVSARLVPDGPQRPRRAVARGGEDGQSAAGPRKRLATALSPDPKVSPDSDTAKLQEMVLGRRRSPTACAT